MQKSPYKVILGRDVPVLIDLLMEKSSNAEVLVTTRQGAKREGQSNVEALKELPFSDVAKQRKTKWERRQAKVQGTNIRECVSNPSANLNLQFCTAAKTGCYIKAPVY